MLKLGITGNIACGKSMVGDYLSQLGYTVIDSDQIVHQLLSCKNDCSEKIVSFCQPHSIISDNSGQAYSYIDRQKLGKLFFSDSDLKLQIELLMHPFVFQSTKNFFDLEEKKGVKISINLIPLLFETNYYSFYQSLFDYTWLIYCNPLEQKSRLQKRNSYLTDKEIELRLNSQMTQEKKKTLVNFTIDNSYSIQKTLEQVDHVLQIMLSSK